MAEVRASINSTDWHTDNCFGCGEKNYAGLKANFSFYEPTGEVRFDYLPKHQLEGAMGYCHGGSLATLLDEGQGVLCFHLGHFVMTDQLYMKYHKAVPIETTIHVRAWITAVRKRRLYTKATLTNDEGDILVSSKASWYIFNERLIRKLFHEYYDEEKLQKLKDVLEANRKRAKQIRIRLGQQK